MIVFSIAKGFHKLTKNIHTELSPKGLDRLRAIVIWNGTKDTSLVCSTYGISRATLYRWINRFDPKDTRSVKDKSCRRRMEEQGIQPFRQTEYDRRYRIPKAWVKVKKPGKPRGKPINEIVEARIQEFHTL